MQDHPHKLNMGHIHTVQLNKIYYFKKYRVALKLQPLIQVQQQVFSTLVKLLKVNFTTELLLAQRVEVCSLINLNSFLKDTEAFSMTHYKIYGVIIVVFQEYYIIGNCQYFINQVFQSNLYLTGM
ncbi:unnamed protein product [Paramecium octaurelia]|uniref:Uncharacterized protein n=1 Tax=Paramecium octaurelia TaxID=43137 RepID=A0A8S1YQB7_PAROT|nr:unnamed protein product [Paramecium octaurelia]